MLGPDVAGLVAAALVARRGKRVLVLPHGPIDGSYRLGARRLATATEPVLRIDRPPLRHALHELGLWPKLRRETSPLHGLSHLLVPGHRLDLVPSWDNLAAECRRRWPLDFAAALQRLHGWTAATDEVVDGLLQGDTAFSDDGFWHRRLLARLATQLPGSDVDELAPLPADQPLRRALRVLLPWVQQLAADQLGKAAALRTNAALLAGPLDLPGGVPYLRDLLLQRIALYSGEVKGELRVAEVLVRRGRVTGVSLLGKPRQYGCDHLLLAADPALLLDGPLQGEQLPKTLLTALGGIRPVAHRYVLHAEADARGLPPGLDRLAVCVGIPDDPEGIGTTYVRVEPGADEPLRHLILTRLVAPDQALDSLREHVLDELDERAILPFFRAHALWIHSPHDGREATDGRGQAVAFGPGSAMRLRMTSIVRFPTPPELGFAALPIQLGVRNLLLASGVSLPGLGLEGEFAAGIAAAARVAPARRTSLPRGLLLRR